MLILSNRSCGSRDLVERRSMPGSSLRSAPPGPREPSLAARQNVEPVDDGHGIHPITFDCSTEFQTSQDRSAIALPPLRDRTSKGQTCWRARLAASRGAKRGIPSHGSDDSSAIHRDTRDQSIRRSRTLGSPARQRDEMNQRLHSTQQPTAGRGIGETVEVQPQTSLSRGWKIRSRAAPSKTKAKDTTSKRPRGSRKRW